jgi:hypothetical protein
MPPALAVNYEYVAYSGTATYIGSSQSLERAFRPVPEPNDPVAKAIKAAGDDGATVSQQTKQSARLLLGALSDRPAPDVTVDSGEIALEWYKDRHHVAVLSVDDKYIRWAAMIGPDKPISGVEFFVGKVPADALDAVSAAT